MKINKKMKETWSQFGDYAKHKVTWCTKLSIRDAQQILSSQLYKVMKDVCREIFAVKISEMLRVLAVVRSSLYLMIPDTSVIAG